MLRLPPPSGRITHPPAREEEEEDGRLSLWLRDTQGPAASLSLSDREVFPASVGEGLVTDVTARVRFLSFIKAAALSHTAARPAGSSRRKPLSSNQITGGPQQS